MSDVITDDKHPCPHPGCLIRGKEARLVRCFGCDEWMCSLDLLQHQKPCMDALLRKSGKSKDKA